MTNTSHGHYISRTPGSKIIFGQRKRCGGLLECSKCIDDAAFVWKQMAKIVDEILMLHSLEIGYAGNRDLVDIDAFDIKYLTNEWIAFAWINLDLRPDYKIVHKNGNTTFTLMPNQPKVMVTK